MKMIQSKKFWSTYKWGTSEESPLIKSSKWILLEDYKDKNQKVYGTEFEFNPYDSSLLLHKNTKKINNKFTIQFEKIQVSDIDKILEWCVNMYGPYYLKYDGTKRNTNKKQTVLNTYYYWKLDNTVLTVRAFSYNKDTLMILSFTDSKLSEIKKPTTTLSWGEH